MRRRIESFAEHCCARLSSTFSPWRSLYWQCRASQLREPNRRISAPGEEIQDSREELDGNAEPEWKPISCQLFQDSQRAAEIGGRAFRAFVSALGNSLASVRREVQSPYSEIPLCVRFRRSWYALCSSSILVIRSLGERKFVSLSLSKASGSASKSRWAAIRTTPRVPVTAKPRRMATRNPARSSISRRSAWSDAARAMASFVSSQRSPSCGLGR